MRKTAKAKKPLTEVQKRFVEAIPTATKEIIVGMSQKPNALKSLKNWAQIQHMPRENTIGLPVAVGHLTEDLKRSLINSNEKGFKMITENNVNSRSICNSKSIMCYSFNCFETEEWVKKQVEATESIMVLKSKGPKVRTPLAYLTHMAYLPLVKNTKVDGVELTCKDEEKHGCLLGLRFCKAGDNSGKKTPTLQYRLEGTFNIPSSRKVLSEFPQIFKIPNFSHQK